jgi:threonine dehydratase
MTPSLGRYTFPLVLRHVHDMMAVPDARTAAAMRWAIDRLKLLVEPTGALGLAGLLTRAAAEPAAYRGTRIGVIISGGNVDLDALPALLALAGGAS